MSTPVLRAAIYARKSTEQKGVADAAKSVPRQIEHAKAFAAKQGWRTSDQWTFEDDGKSGTEFERRHGLQALLAAVGRKAPFQVLIVSEQKALGRELFETQYLIKRLSKAGVDIYEYVHGRCLTPRNSQDKLLASVQGYADEDHGVKTGERTHEGHAKRFRDGFEVGGRTYGYINVDVFAGMDTHGRPLKVGVKKTIDPAQAKNIRRIFQLYASGLGAKAIAKKLHNEGVSPPPPFVRKDPTKVRPLGAWAPATIRTILARELYRGVASWNKSRKRDDWRQINQQRRPDTDHVILPVNEDLRIVSDKLWQQVQSRRADTAGKALRFSDGRMSGRPPKTATRNLLAGLASCGACGGSLTVETSPQKRGRVPEYVCYRHRHYGTCTNKRYMRVREINEAVLQAVEAHALTPEAIEKVIALTERDDSQEQRAALAREQKDAAKRIARLQSLIESGAGDVESIVNRLRDLETRQRAITQQLRAVQPVPRLAPAVVENRLAEWRRLLRSSTTQGRAVLQRIIAGRIIFTPRGNGYTFEAPTRFDKLFSGIAAPRPAFIKESNRGWEHLTPEDTFDGDYGNLLERVYGKRDSSPPGFEPGFQP